MNDVGLVMGIMQFAKGVSLLTADQEGIKTKYWGELLQAVE